MDEIRRIQQALSNQDYEYIDFIGSGSYSTVFLCKSKKYDKQFAVKQVLKKKIAQYEIDALISLVHPYVVKLYQTFSHDDFQYLVMEYCPRGTMKHLHKLDSEKFISYAKQLLEVLDYCHSQKIAHRDIKPDNIFVDRYSHIKLGDFGFAYKFQNNQISNHKCGTIMFWAPEIFLSKEFDPFKADIWALGITFFYMATGCYPFYNESNENLQDLILHCDIDFSKYDIDPRIQSLINSMTIKDPELRPSTGELLDLPLFTEKVMKKNSRSSFKSFSFPMYNFHNNSKKKCCSHMTFADEKNYSILYDDIDCTKQDEKETGNDRKLRRARCFSFNYCVYSNKNINY